MWAKLDSISRNAVYWWVLLLVAVTLEASALYYQHVRDEWPCVMCIHVRIWVLLLIVAAIAGLVLRRRPMARGIMHVVVGATGVGILERAWLLLGTERGTYQGECAIDLGMPDWFAIDQWFPQVFGVWTSCGYTPELFFGITMAEALLVISSLLVVFSMLFAWAAFTRR